MTPEVVKVRVNGAAEAEEVEEQTTEAASEESAQQEAQEYKDRWLRAEAEVENTRKWGERRVRDRVTAERERLLRGFLTVADNLERALGSASAEEDSLREGVALTHRELLRFLGGEGVSPMEELVGKSFDPLYHEAVATVPSSQQDDQGKILEQTQSGYLLDDRPLRPARVVVYRAISE